MGKIIYSDIQEKKCCVRFYKRKIYYAEMGAIFTLHEQKKYKLAEFNTDQRCINAVVDKSKLYYFFENHIAVIENDIISNFECDLRNVDIVEIRNETLYYVKEGHFIKSSIAEDEETSINLKNAVKPQVIKIINSNIVLIGDSKGSLWLIDSRRQISKPFKLHSDSIQDIYVKKDCIVTVSRDKRMKRSVLDVNNMKVIQKQISPEFSHFINCVAQNGNEYFIGLSDGSLVCVDGDFNIKVSKKIHNDAIRFIQKINNNQWMTFSDDGMIYLAECVQTRWKITKRFGHLVDKIQCSCVMNNRIYLGFQSGKIREIDPLGGGNKDICKITNVRSICNLDDDVLICGTESGALYLVRIDKKNSKVVARRGSTPYSLCNSKCPPET